MHALEVLINKEILALHNCREMLIEGPYQREQRVAVERGILTFLPMLRVVGTLQTLG